MRRGANGPRIAAIALTAWLGAGLVAAVSAAAEPVTTPNACAYSYDGTWRDLDLRLGGAAVAADGAVVLDGATIEAALPDYLPLYGYRFGLAALGENAFPSTVWVAIAGTGTVEGTQVVRADVTAHSTITDPTPEDPASGDESATPISVTLPLPATTWTPAGAAEVSFRQAPGGSLPATVPSVRGAVQGSVLISTALGALRFNLDCQPGRYRDDGAAFDPAPAAAFAAVAPAAGADAGAAPTTAPGTTAPGTAAPDPAAPTTAAPVPTTGPADAPAPVAETAAPGTTATRPPGAAAPAGQLARTGLATLGWQIVVALVLVDVGYLVWTSTRPARPGRARRV